MSVNLAHKVKHADVKFTYHDCLSLSDERRYELLEGELYEECGYLSKEAGQELNQTYDHIIGKLVRMIANPVPWILRKAPR